MEGPEIKAVEAVLNGVGSARVFVQFDQRLPQGDKRQWHR